MSWRESLERHYRDVWNVDGTPRLPSRGPIHQLPADFAVLEFPPHEGRDMWTYATRGMSQPEDGAGLELHMFSPVPAGDVVELLVATAHFHRTGSRLGLAHTVNFGRSWMGDSECDHGLISLPYLDGPALENLRIGDTDVRCLWLVPVTADEVEFKRKYGLEALERRFEAVGLNYVEPRRRSVLAS